MVRRACLADAALACLQSSMAGCFSALLLCILGFAVAAHAVPINVALNKPATANSQYSTNEPVLAVDGDWGTLWNAGDRGAPAPHENWLLIDLEGVFDPLAIILGHPHSGPYDGYTLEYILEYSDGSTDGGGNLLWTFIADDVLVDLPQNTPGEIPPYGPYVDVWDMSGAVESAELVRVRFDGGTHWSGLTEIIVMAEPPGGNGTEPAIPEPATLSLLALSALALRRKKRQ